VTLNGQVVTQICLDANIPKTLIYRDLVPMDNRYKMAYDESIGHVIDDVT